MKVFILGAGTWGTALAGVLNYNGHEVTLWHRKSRSACLMEKERVHPNLPGYVIPSDIRIVNSFKDILNSQLLLITIPSQAVRNVLEQLPALPEKMIIVSGSKGLENNTLMRVSEIITSVLSVDMDRVVALSGPSHAEEVCEKLPTAVVSACTDINTARKVQSIFNSPFFRVYSTEDLIGVELGGAIKNVIAIAAGICDGVGYGDNTVAALITRGLAEIIRLGGALGGWKDTFFGLSGIGDLVVTANSKLSRNRNVGREIGSGKPLKEVLEEMNMVAEGVATAKSIHDLIKRTGVEMPISEQIYKVLFLEKNARKAILELMMRTPVDEKL